MESFNIDEPLKVFKQTLYSNSVINKIFINIKEVIEQLKEIYDDLVFKYNKKQFIIMLDTFHFQKNLLKTEYDNLVVLRDIILNRIYCDYYKLNIIIKNYINENICWFNLKNDLTILNQFLLKLLPILQKKWSIR